MANKCSKTDDAWSAKVVEVEKRYSRESTLQGTTYVSKCMHACVEWLDRGGVVDQFMEGLVKRGLFERG